MPSIMSFIIPICFITGLIILIIKEVRISYKAKRKASNRNIASSSRDNQDLLNKK